MKSRLLNTNLIICAVTFILQDAMATALYRTKFLEPAIVKSHLYKDTTVSDNSNHKQSDNPHSQTLLTPSYGIISNGNYVYRNASNGHISDIRATSYGNNAGAELSVSQTGTSNAGQQTHTDAMVTQCAADGNSGFRLQLAKDSNTYAQTGFYFMRNASDNYIEGEDAAQINGPNASLFLSSYSADGVNLCMNTMSNFASGKRIRLNVNAANSGTYTLSMVEINEMDTCAYNLYIIDNLKKDSVNLENTNYFFSLNLSDTSSFGAHRFVLAIEHKPMPKYVLTNFSGQKISTGVQLSWTALNAGNYTGYTLQKLNAGSTNDSLYFIQSDSGVNAYSFVDLHPVIGDNVYRLKQNGIAGDITFSAIVTVGYNSEGSNGTLKLYPNPVQSTMNVSISSASINSPANLSYIYNAMGTLVKRETVSGMNWSDDVSSYKQGLYFIQVKDMNGNVIGQSKFVKAE